MKQSKSDYRGGAALTLATRALELVVATGVGPCVVSLKSRTGRVGNDGTAFVKFPPPGRS